MIIIMMMMIIFYFKILMFILFFKSFKVHGALLHFRHLTSLYHLWRHPSTIMIIIITTITIIIKTFNNDNFTSAG